MTLYEMILDKVQRNDELRNAIAERVIDNLDVDAVAEEIATRIDLDRVADSLSEKIMEDVIDTYASDIEMDLMNDGDFTDIDIEEELRKRESGGHRGWNADAMTIE